MRSRMLGRGQESSVPSNVIGELEEAANASPTRRDTVPTGYNMYGEPEYEHTSLLGAGYDSDVEEGDVLSNSDVAANFHSHLISASKVEATDIFSTPLSGATTSTFLPNPTLSPLFEPEHSPLPMDSPTDDSELLAGNDFADIDNGPDAWNADGLKRARALKAEIENNISVLKQNKKAFKARRRVEDDPENQRIKELRQDHKMDWTAIANYLNEERLKNGQAPVCTQASVYSRFVRNAPRIAASKGEVGFDPKDYMHLRHPHRYAHNEPNNMFVETGRTNIKRIKDPGDAKELAGNVRKRSKLHEDAAELETVDKTNLLMEAVATVERNFFVFVADELERTTAKLYDPRAIESRYHAI
ncbi:hypothetical protein BDV95DRAFT_607725 [Massariosphaeria phaeospora]|uniref:Uncharacterized protein n=1 Tax=Massariosphaeria phaeospora TaxID=100035 RepID=A0A7C8IDP2_9PLEO|nr:hypothetical protein BDV95DRAFT_607725 [Massariosphaeria phaeospora]